MLDARRTASHVRQVLGGTDLGLTVKEEVASGCSTSKSVSSTLVRKTGRGTAYQNRVFPDRSLSLPKEKLQELNLQREDAADYNLHKNDVVPFYQSYT